MPPSREIVNRAPRRFPYAPQRPATPARNPKNSGSAIRNCPDSRLPSCERDPSHDASTSLARKSS